MLKIELFAMLYLNGHSVFHSCGVILVSCIRCGLKSLDNYPQGI